MPITNTPSSILPRLTTKTCCLLGLVTLLICVNIYFLYSIVIPSKTPSSSLPVIPPTPYTPPYYGVPDQRIPPNQRKFTSNVIDDYIHHKAKTMADKDLVTLLKNCFPNTLDTTIEWHDLDFPHTFLITGDIPAMWIRDSTNQILPYLPFATQDKRLASLILGVLKTQGDYLHYDPYANAFLRPWYATSKVTNGRIRDRVIPQYDSQYVWESKYELDSLAHFFQLGNEYIETTGDSNGVFSNILWIRTVRRIFQVIHEQQKGTWETEEKGQPPRVLYNTSHLPHPLSHHYDNLTRDAPLPLPLDQGYRFTRMTDRPTETLGANGLGGISKRCGLVKSAFRPSDDATTFPYLIPANAHLSAQLKKLAQHIRTSFLHQHQLKSIAAEAQTLGDTIHQAIYTHGIINHAIYGNILAYEVDCYGSYLLMDDANTPSLLSLPLLGFIDRTDPLYQRTRAFILSSANPWYFEGTFGKGIGGPHTGHAMIWPISLLIQIQTATDEDEIKILLDTLKRLASQATHGYMVESFHKDNPKLFTRPWFSWANGLLGATIADLDARFPHLL
ncbi:hypothetical protein BC941DRAFT_400228 [Chlamydoabsidia padenii]|nr:hypothetical protein BC941DRAFT_400228 [Chlamydoabsidia padenii]